jgi:hypothetical protein
MTPADLLLHCCYCVVTLFEQPPCVQLSNTCVDLLEIFFEDSIDSMERDEGYCAVLCCAEMCCAVLCR